MLDAQKPSAITRTVKRAIEQDIEATPRNCCATPHFV